MHHVMALARSEHASVVQAVLDYLRSAGSNSAQAALARHLAGAAAAYCRGEPRKALEDMLAVRQRHGELGASYAQQDIYDQIMIMAALQLGDWPRVRQLLKARLTTRIWDEVSWRAYEGRSRRIDEAHNAAEVRAALRWEMN
jgi:hypothetical protein